MGWEKSEQSNRTRILSAFGVHPYILGEPVNVGGYAQAAKIEERFCKRVNTPLDMLSVVMTDFVNHQEEAGSEKLFIWWEKCESCDPSLRQKTYQEARRNNDITRDEYRAEMGLPPAEELAAKKSKLLETVGGMTGAVAIFNGMGLGSISPESAAQLFSLFFEVPIEDAKQLVGKPTEVDTLEESNEALGEAVRALKISPSVIAEKIVTASRNGAN